MFVNRKRIIDPNQNPEAEQEKRIEQQLKLDKLGLLDLAIFNMA